MAFQASQKDGSTLYRPLADINVTPLVDVMLVLLIVFMITAPMLAAGMKVNLPQAKAAMPLKPRAPVVVTISKDGQIQVNGADTATEVLVDTIRARLVGADDDVIHLRGDREAAYGTVVAVMDQLATNGLVKLAIISDRRDQTPMAPPGATGSGIDTAVPGSAAPTAQGGGPKPQATAAATAPAMPATPPPSAGDAH
ncbi:MAG: biopolymer transporter ExbD [Ancalomicrobiaceae bacterium]|nr:biopolymer transporter ExbD [Ancalomicrobiaceae bacterium]